MASIKYLISKMPLYIRKKYSHSCIECGHKLTTEISLKLQINMIDYMISDNNFERRYKMYYGGLGKFIGNPDGAGFLTLKEALRDLLTYKKDIRGER